MRERTTGGWNYLRNRKNFSVSVEFGLGEFIQRTQHRRASSGDQIHNSLRGFTGLIAHPAWKLAEQVLIYSSSLLFGSRNYGLLSFASNQCAFL